MSKNGAPTINEEIISFFMLRLLQR